MLFVMQILTLILTFTACGQADDASQDTAKEEDKTKEEVITAEEQEKLEEAVSVQTTQSGVEVISWIDTVTGNEWIFFGLTKHGPVNSLEDYTPVCDEGYSIPAYAELHAAANNGMYVAMQSKGEDYRYYWHALSGNARYYRYDAKLKLNMGGEGVVTQATPQNTQAMAVCVKKDE